MSAHHVHKQLILEALEVETLAQVGCALPGHAILPLQRPHLLILRCTAS